MNERAPIAPPDAPHSPGNGAAISVSEGYCINLRGRLDACDLCQRACHTAAITLTRDEVTIDPAPCVGCGACVPACPAGAITHKRFDPEAFSASAVTDRVARIDCAQSETGGSAIPCHRMLDARLMAALFAEGAARIEITGTENCLGCPSGDARPALAVAVRTLGSWFGERAPQVVFAGAETGTETGNAAEAKRATERRHLLRGAFRTLSADPRPAPPATAPSFDDLLGTGETGEITVARPVPYQQALALHRADLPFRKGGQVGATGRTIGEECSGCMVCAELCPTGALGSDVAPGHRLVSFDPALCTNCTLCLKVCPMAVISARALRGVAAATSGREILFARVERTCTECGAGFAAASGGAVCPECEKDREMDDEWLEILSG